MRRSLAAASAAFRQLKFLDSCLTQTARFSSRAAQETGRSSSSTSALGLFGAAVGVAALTCSFSSEPHVALAEAPVVDAPAAPEVNSYLPPAELKGTLPKEVVLYQYEVCPFCCKVKAFLDYHKIPYRCVEVNPLTKAELRWSEYRKVPVVLLDGEQVNDSSSIISRLSAEIMAQRGREGQQAGGMAPKQGVFGVLFGGSSGKQAARVGACAEGATPLGESSQEEERWRRWVDEWFVRVITVNIYRNARESFQTFDYITQNGKFSWWEREAARVVGATMMWGLSGKLKKKYHVEGDVRENLYKSADEWLTALGSRKFMGGDHPDNADISMFGVIRSVVGTPTFHDLMHNTKISGWYERMMGAVGDSAQIES